MGVLRLAALGLMSIVQGVCAHADPGAPRAGDLRTEAVQAHQSGGLGAALVKYQAILRQKPAFVPALSNAGAAHYGHAPQAGGENAGIRLHLALAHYNQSTLQHAIQELGRVQPSTQQSTLLLADCFLRTGENNRVVALLERQEDSNDRVVSYLLGTALIHDQHVARENRRSIVTLERALARNPGLHGLYSLYGLAKLAEGSPVEAREAFSKELRLDPFNYDSNLSLGLLYRLEQDWENARKFLERKRRLCPEASKLKYQIATLELGNGDVVEATRLLEEIAAVEPGFVEGHIALATAYYRQMRKADRLNAKMQARELRTP